MKKIILFYIGLLLLPIFQSCEVEEDVRTPEAYNATWVDDVTLKFTPTVSDVKAFEYYVEYGENGDKFWNRKDLDYNISVELGKTSISEISKIEIYAFLEETNGDAYTYLGGDLGKLYTTITNPSDSFQLSVTIDKLEELFKNDLSSARNGQISGEDFFEFKWVITGKDGYVLDSRKNCLDFNCTYGIRTNIVYVAPPIWEGTFNYEWIAATADAQQWGKISIGQTGTMTFTLQPGFFTEYNVSHLSADYYYGSAGTLSYNYETGLVTISGSYEQKWDIVDVTGPTITIDFSYRYSAAYNEYGTFTLTRTDGQDWPANIHTE